MILARMAPALLVVLGALSDVARADMLHLEFGRVGHQSCGEDTLLQGGVGVELDHLATRGFGEQRLAPDLALAVPGSVVQRMILGGRQPDRQTVEPIDFNTCGSPAGSDHRSPCELRIAIPEDVALPAGPQGIASSTGRSYAADFLIALVVTLLVELPILWVVARGVFKLKAVSTRRLLAVSALGSLLTLPVLWFVLPAFLPPLVAVVLGETLAVAVEALLYWHLLPARPLVAVALSLAANLASFAVGLLVF